jgi:glycerol kinase
VQYILALDQGTTSSRALLFDQEGTVRAVAQREFDQIFPQPGWVEHNPEQIAFFPDRSCPRSAGPSGSPPADVAAIGIANQRETTIVWNRETGQPVYNAIVWQDRRTADVCDLTAQPGPQSADPAAHRTADRFVLFRHEDFVDSR